MAKKVIKEEIEVTNCDIKDSNMEVVTSCDQLSTNNICSKIYNIRGQEVMLDRELA